MKPIPTDKNNSVEACLCSGESYHTISHAVGVSVGMVVKIAKQLGITAKPKLGQPHKITTILGCSILQSFNTGEYKNSVDAIKKLAANGYAMNPQTVCNLLHDAKFGSCIKKTALPLMLSHKKAHLSFAQK